MAKSFRSHRFFLGVASAALLVTSFPVITQAQDAGDEEQDAVGSIIVTGARIRQGGAQDIKHFRSVSVNGGQSLPHASSLTLEGLMLPANAHEAVSRAISTKAVPTPARARLALAREHDWTLCPVRGGLACVIHRANMAAASPGASSRASCRSIIRSCSRQRTWPRR